MGDLPAAARHLETLTPRDDILLSRLALTYIHLGDLDAAKNCLTTLSTPTPLTPLLTMASVNYSAAISEWRALPSSDLVTQNLAVCLFYIGKVDETVELLEGLVNEKGRSFHALTFNLATVFELCSEKGRERKGELVERVEREGMGERGAADFKL